MLYIGLDIHIRHITFCILDENGQIVERGKCQTLQQIMDVLERLKDRFEVCYEASCGYGHFHDLFSPVASRVVVAHPGQLRLIFRSKNKNDRNDAERLAKLLYLGEVPTVHVPNLDVRAWRELINCRSQVVVKRTKAKNGIRSLLRSSGVTAPKSPNLWTKQGHAWLRKLELPTESQRLRRDLLLEEVESLTKQVYRIERELNRRGRESTAVFQLRSIPGVGPRTAEAVVACIDDPHRFPNAKAVGRYFGLVPMQDQSGDKNRLGHITREGPPVVRQLLAEATWLAQRSSPTVRAYFERVQRDDPQRKKIALVATAHYLVRVMYAMLKNGTMWRETVTA